MNKIIALLFGLMLLTSCEMKEKVYLNADNSVKYAFEVDMTTMSQMMALDSDAKEDEFPMDSIMSMKEFLEGDFMGKSKKRDKEELKKAEQLFQDFQVHVKIDEKAGFFSFFTKKNNIAEMNATMAKFRDNLASAKKSNDSEEEEALSEFLGNLTLAFDGKKFSRTGDINLSSLSDKEESEDKLAELAGMLTYSLEYHFPKPVKSISDTSVLMSWDRKTVYLKKPITELMQNPKAYNFTLELED